MKKRIFWSILLSCFLTLLITAAFVTRVLYVNSWEEYKHEIEIEALYVGEAVNVMDTANGAAARYLEEVGRSTKNRITLIAADGSVLFDSYADEDDLDNHLSRPEIADALSAGSGQAERLSDTFGARCNTFGARSYYSALRLDDGSVLRIGGTSKSVLGIIGNALVWIVVVSAFVLLITVLAASLLTGTIIRPINKIDLNAPLAAPAYDELSPLLLRMEKQNARIHKQIRELSKQREEFHYITGNMSEGLVIFDDHGAVLTINSSAESILGCGAQPVFEDSAADGCASYLKLSRDLHYIRTVEAALDGRPAVAEMERNGRLYRLSATPVERREDSRYAAVLFIVDVTDRERAEQLRKEFSANVSHELKTPLTTIMGYAEIIGNGIARTEDIPEFAGKIRLEAARLLSLIEDIIKLSRLDENELTSRFEPVELAEVCRSVVKKLSDKAQKADVSLTFAGSPCVVNGIESILYEILFNLTDNAIIYNRKGGEVRLSLTEAGGRATVVVEDTGIGIAPEHQSRIFERFYRVDKSHSKASGGTGLGLSIVKHAVAYHHGTVQLESQPGKGTTITVTIPKKQS